MLIFLARPLRWRYRFHPSSLKLDRITSRLGLDKRRYVVYTAVRCTTTTYCIPVLVSNTDNNYLSLIHI